MFTSTVLAGFTALLCSSFTLVDARIVQRDVVSPPITYPTTGTVWNVNDRHNVTWDTSVIPPGTTSNGMIVLGFLDDADGSNEHLDLNNPLAAGFPITAGRAEITVPSVTTRNSYILVLFGDSGNASGKFTIKNISIGSTASSTASSSASSPTSAPTTDSQGSASPGQGTPTASSSEAVLSVVSRSSATGTAVAAQASSTAPALSASSAASSGASTTQVQPAAQSATSHNNAGVRTASFGDASTWISTMCSIAVVLGFAL